MTFASRITRSPHAFDPDRGADARALFPDASPELAGLIEGAGGCSPYLLGLMTRDTEWLAEALESAPEAAVDAVLAELPDSAEALPDALRIAKRRVALLAGLADLGGVWTLEEVTGALTRLADRAVDAGMRALVATEIARGKLPGLGPDDAASCGGMVALAMGKMGAGELNYSSDIDLICLFDESRFDPDDYADARASFIRVTRRLMAMLSDLTAEGYVFRTDLRLRPDPSATPVCLSMEAAERYYESVGRTWERAAFIKARSAAGDITAGEEFLTRLRPFVWRKHLDFAAIQDAHDMRLRIREHKGLGGPIALPGHNMKLGQGGIREIEFFTQTRQLIAGGRDPGLRQRGTVPGLAALAEKGWVPEDVSQVLTEDYRAHREVEHRLQMVNDAQTHDLPAKEDGFARLAAFMGRDVAGLKSELKDRLDRVAGLTEGFFAPQGGGATPLPDLSETGREIVSRWRTYPALRSPRAIEIFDRLRPDLLKRLQSAARPEEALVHLDAFLSRLPAGVQIFSLFEANPVLIDLIIDIAATSPALAAYLGRNAGVLDAVIGGAFFADWPGQAALTEELTRVLDRAGDYGTQLDAARRWMKEWHFRIGVHHLRGLIGAEAAGREYADLAGAIVAAIWPVVVAEFAAKHGAMPGNGAVVLGMGSLGAGWLTSGSDLDLIVIYDPAKAEMSEGRRPLAVRPYYARLTQALVTALTAAMPEGRLYEVDMRLRPSGRQGPVATSIQSFEAYQRDEAWTWEHLALTRARAVAGEADLADRAEAFRRELLRDKGDPEVVLADVADMRGRIAEAKGAGTVWDVKGGPGGVQDIELLGQAGALMAGCTAQETPAQLASAVDIGWLSAREAATLTRIWHLLQGYRTAARLLAETAVDPADLGAGATAMLLRETGVTTAADLGPALHVAADEAANVIDAALSRPPATR